MTGNQKKLWPLLQELIRICEEEDIPWFLSGRTAIRCVLNREPFYKSFLDVEITIPIWYAKKLISSIEERNTPGRALEGLHNSAYFPGLYLKYVDTNTTLFPVNEGFSTREKGLFVKICFLKNNPGEETLQKLQKIETLIRDTAGRSVPSEIGWGERFLFRWKRRLRGVCFSCKRFDFLVASYGQEGSQVLSDTVSGEPCACPRDRFQQTETWCWKETVLRLPADVEGYCRMIGGDHWRKFQDDVILEGNKATMIVPGGNNLASAKIPYAQLLPVMKKAGLTERLLKRRVCTSRYNQQHKELSQCANLVWKLAQRAGDLILIRDTYSPQMDKICRLMEARQMDEVKGLLAQYDSTVRKYAEMDMGFYWDEQLQEIYLSLLYIYGEDSFGDWVKELVQKDPHLNEQLERLLDVRPVKS